MNSSLDRTTDTPRTDAFQQEQQQREIAYRGKRDDTVSLINLETLDFARQLERELAEAKKPPPCQHTQRSGRMVDGKCEWWCQQCLKQMDSGYVTIDSLTVPWTLGQPK